MFVTQPGLQPGPSSSHISLLYCTEPWAFPWLPRLTAERLQTVALQSCSHSNFLLLHPGPLPGVLPAQRLWDSASHLAYSCSTCTHIVLGTLTYPVPTYASAEA